MTDYQNHPAVAAERLLKDIASDYQGILGKNLTGVYLHGSLAMDCFNPKTSDIDFLVVVKHPINHRQKERLVEILLSYDALAPAKGFEMSVLLLSNTMTFTYPTPFLLHYSPSHKEAFIKNGTLCENGSDPDLAAHITVLKKRGRIICGDTVERVFGDVPKSDYRRAIRYDLEDVDKMLDTDTTYFVLNLCRTLYYVEEEVIASKREGGEWALKHLPEAYSQIIQNALIAYKTGAKGYRETSVMLRKFVEDLFSRIDRFLCPE